MIFAFFIAAGGAAVLLIISGNRYRELLRPVDRRIYGLKELMPIGLYAMELIRYKYSTRYDRGLLDKLTELYGARYAQYYLRIHWANKISALIVSAVITMLFGASTGPGKGLAVFGAAMLGAVFYLTDRELYKRVKKRRTDIQLDFPDFINKLTLLINAGMTVSGAWRRIAEDSKRDGPLYQELKETLAEIRGGKPEIQSYEDFAKRCRIPQVTKFISIIIQNLKKGNSELIPILRLQAGECWDMRKSTARRLGEEASTKLLFPMMIMFIAILIIVAVPAMLAIQGI